MRTKTRDVRDVDGLDGNNVSAQIFYSMLDDGNFVEVSCNDHAWPHQSAQLAPSAARMLARHLLELADDADLLNSARSEDVEMVCTACRRPADMLFGSDAWGHRDPASAFRCPASPVKVMVAAGA